MKSCSISNHTRPKEKVIDTEVPEDEVDALRGLRTETIVEHLTAQIQMKTSMYNLVAP